MKTLFLTRHAKSSWDQPYLEDIDRPLKKRGINDAHLMAELIAKRGSLPERIISSPAARARLTAQLFAEDLEMDPEGIVIFDQLYLSSPETMLEILKKCDEKWKSVMLVAHNPGITYFVNSIQNVSVDNVPTAGVAVINFDVDKWKDIDMSLAVMGQFEYPSKYK